MIVLFHIATAAEWGNRSTVDYRPAGLDVEGFVHCSAADQLVEVANRLFGGRTDLWVLTIDSASLAADVVWEDSYGTGTDYPHVYGPIELSAIVDVTALVPDRDGRFDGWNPA